MSLRAAHCQRQLSPTSAIFLSFAFLQALQKTMAAVGDCRPHPLNFAEVVTVPEKKFAAVVEVKENDEV